MAVPVHKCPDGICPQAGLKLMPDSESLKRPGLVRLKAGIYGLGRRGRW